VLCQLSYTRAKKAARAANGPARPKPAHTCQNGGIIGPQRPLARAIDLITNRAQSAPASQHPLQWAMRVWGWPGSMGHRRGTVRSTVALLREPPDREQPAGSLLVPRCPTSATLSRAFRNVTIKAPSGLLHTAHIAQVPGVSRVFWPRGGPPTLARAGLRKPPAL